MLTTKEDSDKTQYCAMDPLTRVKIQNSSNRERR